MMRARSILLSFCALLLSGPLSAAVVTYNWWDGSEGDTLWSNPANWSNNKIPAANSNIKYDGDGLSDCTVDGDYTVKNFWIDGGYGGYGPYPYTVTIPAGCSLTVTEGFRVAGNLVVEGTLRLLGTTSNLLESDTDLDGNLTIAAGGQLELAVGAPFTAQADTTFTINGAFGNVGVVIAAGGAGVLGNFTLSGNVSLSYAAFHNMNDNGLQLLSTLGQSVSASNVSFGLSGATTNTSQHLLVNGSAWDGYTFVGFNFNAGAGSLDPAYAVQSSQDITFSRYATGTGKLYGDSETDPASTGTVIWEPADLVIDAIVPSNSNPQTGDTISVSVTVRNAGSAPASNFPVDLFFNPGGPPSVGDTGDRRRTVLSLTPGASTVVTFVSITNGTAETWNMYAVVDTTDVITEIDDTVNNVAGPVQVIWTDPGGDKPDLRILSITPTSTTPPVGGTISVDVVVENNGAGDCGSFRVDLFYNRGSAPVFGDTGNQNKTVSGLVAGNQTTVTFTGITSGLPADWQMWGLLDTYELIDEDDETNNAGGPVDIQWRGIDLIITDITPSAASPLIDTNITVDVTIRNQGNVNSGTFDVGLFYNPPGAPSPGGAANQTLQDSLTAGQSKVITFTNVSSAVAANWNMYAIIDNKASGGDITEYNENNNVFGPEAVTWRAPDLIILSVTPSNSSPTVGDTITVDVVVKNQGNANASQFDVGLYYNEAAAPTPGQGADDTLTVNAGLTAGSQTTLTFVGIQNFTAETWQMYAIADDKVSGGDVDEGDDEDNNVKGPVEVVWGAAGTSPDLIIVSVVPSNTDPSIGELIDVVVTVENQGNADAGSFDVGLFYNPGGPPTPGDPADKTQNVSSLAQGVQVPLTFTDVTSAVAESWSMYAVADNKVNPGDVTESDEDNNVSTASAVDWHAPNLVITSISPATNDPNVGDTITVSVTVENQGDADADSFNVALFYNKATPPNPGDPADKTQNVASLTSGNSTIVQFTGVTSSVFATWSTYAIADNGRTVEESNENDNRDGPETITWHGPDLVISAITPTDSTPTTSDSIDISVTVRNLGDRDAGAFVVALFLNSATAPPVGSPTSYTAAVGALTAGNNTTVTFTSITNAIEEVWKTWAIADNGMTVIEGDETNNVGGPVTIIWGAPQVPDLVVLSIVPSDSSPNTGDTISVDVTIANNGTIEAASFDVGLYYNLGAPPTAVTPTDQTKGVGTIAPSAQKVVTFTGVTNLTPEIWNMYAMVDCGDVVVESNEANNTKGPVQVNWGSVAGIEVLVPNGGEEWEAGTTQQIEWSSYGDIGSSNVVIEYSINGGTDWDFVVSSTPDDGVFDWEVPLADSTQCLVKVSSEGASYEDESDDLFTIVPAGIGKPNLRIISISPSNSMPNTSDIITVDVTVRNIGSATSGMFYVDLFYNRSNEPDVGEAGDQSKSVPILSEGSEVNVVFTDVSSAVAGAWEMYAIVDTQDYVDESNEGDNVEGPTQVGWSTMVDTFRITAPNGFELLEQGQAFDITWTWTGNPGALAQIELSTDGGATWVEIISNTSNDGTYEWTVPAVSSADCRVRISNSIGDVTDVSDDVFTIQKAPLTFLGGGCGGTVNGPSGGGDAGCLAGQLALLAAFLALAGLLRRRIPTGTPAR